MSDDENALYFNGRAATERLMAERSTDLAARDAHRQLADLYAGKASQHRQVALLAQYCATSGHMENS